jgi:hypothetical protein
MLMSTSLICWAEKSSFAEAVDGPWQNADTFGDGPLHFPDTNSPIVGEDPNDPDFNSNDADQEMIFSPFSLMSLNNPGDKIVFTGSVELVGTINSPTTSGTPRTQFRFGLFKDNESANETGWLGYFMHNKHGNAGTPQGVLAYKPVGNTSVFLSTTGQITLQAQQGDGTAASLFNDGTYNLSLSIERNVAGELVVNSSIVGTGFRPDGITPNEFSQIMSGIHSTVPATGTYQFDRLGFLTGGNLDADRAAYMNLDVTFTPGAPAGLTGDYNDDGTVDAADYVVWAKGGELENETAPAGAGPEDYDAWVEQFGATSPGAGGAVPEPASVVLLAFGIVAVVCRRQRSLNN